MFTMQAQATTAMAQMRQGAVRASELGVAAGRTPAPALVGMHRQSQSVERSSVENRIGLDCASTGSVDLPTSIFGKPNYLWGSIRESEEGGHTQQ
jgi:hypothetical protein